MTDTPDGSPAAPNLRCHRLEIVDELGEVRITLGNVSVLDGDYEPGVVIYDEQGAERMTLALFAHGPQLSFAADGTGVIDLYVADPGPEAGSGAAHLILADGTGQAVIEHVVPLDLRGQWPDPRPRRRPPA